MPSLRPNPGAPFSKTILLDDLYRVYAPSNYNSFLGKLLMKMIFNNEQLMIHLVIEIIVSNAYVISTKKAPWSSILQSITYDTPGC